MQCAEQCKFLYECIEGICRHKNFWPPTLVELIGILITGVFSGFASLAGIGGGGIMVSIFTLFFNYSEKEAVLIVFVPVFGASLGNFLNLIKQVDPQSKEPIVNIRRAIVSCPIMIIGSITGILMNKFLSGICTKNNFFTIKAFFIVAFLEYFIIKVLLKFIKQAMKETKIENERRRQQQNLLVQVELKDLSAEQKVDVLEKLLSNKDALITAFCIVGFILVGYLLRGARNFQSVIGIQYCGFGYWALTSGLIYAMHQAFQYVCDKFLENKSHKEEYMVQSFKAGIINGFGLGGGSFLVPLYISVGIFFNDQFFIHKVLVQYKVLEHHRSIFYQLHFLLLAKQLYWDQLILIKHFNCFYQPLLDAMFQVQQFLENYLKEIDFQLQCGLWWHLQHLLALIQEFNFQGNGLLLDFLFLCQSIFNQFVEYIFQINKMLQKFLDQKKKEGEQASQNETDDQRLKRLMLEKKKNRNQEAKLPKEAQLVDGLLQCTVCGQMFDVIVEFNKHLKQQRHQSILQQQEDKRKATVDAQLLEIESQKIAVLKSKQKLTKNVIERINREVEEEFKDIIIQEQQQVPQNFFEKMEQEFFVQKQQQEIEIQIDDDEQSDVNIEELKAKIGKKTNTQEIEKMIEQKYAVSDDDEDYQDWRQV